MSGSDYWFQRYGGPGFWQHLSERFYEKVAASSLRKYFKSVSADRIKEVAGDMWQVVLGFTGPLSTTAIESQHRQYHISENDFRTYSQLLRETLEEEAMEREDVSEIIDNLDRLKQYVCG